MTEPMTDPRKDLAYSITASLLVVAFLTFMIFTR
jgi:hypothetical protein